MIKINELKGIIACRNTSQNKVAEAIGMNPKTFYKKMNRGIFGSDEIEKMIEFLKIENPMEIFFFKE